jgi:phage terminase large subunit
MAACSKPNSPSSSSEILIPKAFQGLFEPGWRDFAAFGGRGGAKSHSVAGALVILAAQTPLRIVCAREIQGTLRDSVKKLVEDKIEAFGLGDHFDPLALETRGRNGSCFTYKGLWRNPDAIKSLEGADIFWGEEANRFSARSIRLVRPTMRKPGSRMIWTWNPEFDFDPVDRMFRGPAGPPPASTQYPRGSLVRQVSFADNPWFADSPLQAEMAHDYAANPSLAAHVWGGDYVSAIDGAYYAAQLNAARAEGRIGFVAADPVLRMRAFWDLGHRDATAIWIAQFVGREIRVLDYVEGRGQLMAWYIEQLRAKGYAGALCVLPHDGAATTLISKGSAREQLEDAGFGVDVIANQGRGAALQRIEAARRLFPAIWINEDTTRAGVKALAAYHERRDENRNIGLGPLHDWASDPADAFGLMCVAYEQPTAGAPKRLEIPNFGAV